MCKVYVKHHIKFLLFYEVTLRRNISLGNFVLARKKTIPKYIYNTMLEKNVGLKVSKYSR